MLEIQTILFYFVVGKVVGWRESAGAKPHDWHALTSIVVRVVPSAILEAPIGGLSCSRGESPEVSATAEGGFASLTIQHPYHCLPGLSCGPTLH